MVCESSAHGRRQAWWYCLKHNTVEQARLPGKDRLGPYPTRKRRRTPWNGPERNKEWDAARTMRPARRPIG